MAVVSRVRRQDLSTLLLDIAARCEPTRPEPLFFQLASELASAVRAGRIESQTLLPSEPQMARLMGISPWTVKRAVTHLVENGVAVRRRGVGTVIVPPAGPAFRSGLSEELSPVDGSALHRDVHVEERSARPDEREFLGLDDDGTVRVVTRVLRKDGRPVGIAESRIPGAVRVDIGAVMREGLYPTMARDLSAPAYGAETVRARPASPQECGLLDVPCGHWVLAVDRRMRTAKGDPVEIASHAYLPDGFAASTVLR